MKEVNMQSSIEELKVVAWDTLSEVEKLQKQLQILNGMIAQKSKAPDMPEEEPKEKIK